MKTLATIVGAVVLIVLSSIWYGYVLSIVWGWFITPTFSTPHLRIPAAIGVAAAIRFITSPYSESKDEDEHKPASERILSGIIKAFVVPAFTLFFCWIVKHWM